MKSFTFLVKNEDGTVHTNYEEELREEDVQRLRRIIYKMISKRDKYD